MSSEKIPSEKNRTGILQGVVDHVKMEDKSMISHGLYQLNANIFMNNFDNASEWKQLISSVDNPLVYQVLKYGDYISTFQVYNSTNEKFDIQLICTDWNTNSDSNDLVIGTYTIKSGNNNIIPVYGNPGLMVSAMSNFSFTIHSPKPIEINVLNVFCDKSSREFHSNVIQSDLTFIGPQGDVFSYDRIGLRKIDISKLKD